MVNLVLYPLCASSLLQKDALEMGRGLETQSGCCSAQVSEPFRQQIPHQGLPITMRKPNPGYEVLGLLFFP